MLPEFEVFAIKYGERLGVRGDIFMKIGGVENCNGIKVSGGAMRFMEKVFIQLVLNYLANMNLLLQRDLK